MRTFIVTLSGPTHRALDNAIFHGTQFASRTRIGARSADVTYIMEEGGLDEVQDLIDIERIEAEGCQVQGMAEVE